MPGLEASWHQHINLDVPIITKNDWTSWFVYKYNRYMFTPLFSDDILDTLSDRRIVSCFVQVSVQYTIPCAALTLIPPHQYQIASLQNDQGQMNERWVHEKSRSKQTPLVNPPFIDTLLGVAKCIWGIQPTWCSKPWSSYFNDQGRWLYSKVDMSGLWIVNVMIINPGIKSCGSWPTSIVDFVWMCHVEIFKNIS